MGWVPVIKHSFLAMRFPSYEFFTPEMFALENWQIGASIREFVKMQPCPYASGHPILNAAAVAARMVSTNTS